MCRRRRTRRRTRSRSRTREPVGGGGRRRLPGRCARCAQSGHARRDGPRHPLSTRRSSRGCRAGTERGGWSVRSLDSGAAAIGRIRRLRGVVIFKVSPRSRGASSNRSCRSTAMCTRSTAAAAARPHPPSPRGPATAAPRAFRPPARRSSRKRRRPTALAEPAARERGHAACTRRRSAAAFPRPFRLRFGASPQRDP